MFQSLPLLLLAVVGGITSVTGALIGGLLLGMQGDVPGPAGTALLLTGGLAIFVSRYQNGIAGLLFNLRKRARPSGPAGGSPDRADERATESDTEVLEEVSAGATA